MNKITIPASPGCCEKIWRMLLLWSIHWRLRHVLDLRRHRRRRASRLANLIQLLSAVPLWGLTMAAGVLTRDYRRHDGVGRLRTRCTSWAPVLLAAIMVALRDGIFGVFTNDPLILAGPSWRRQVFQYFDGVRMVSSGILQGAGDIPGRHRILMWGMFIPLMVPGRRRRQQRDHRKLITKVLTQQFYFLVRVKVLCNFTLQKEEIH